VSGVFTDENSVIACSLLIACRNAEDETAK
jgi:hypothetical protein